MTIDGTNISTLGLRLLSVDGLYSRPARKKILNEQGFEEKDIVFEEKEITVILMGKFADKPSILASTESLKTLIRGSLVHDIVILGRSLPFSGVVKKGFKADVVGNVVNISLTLQKV